MRIHPFVLAVVVGLMASSGVQAGHHDLTVLYERDRTMTLTGSVSAVQWTNPHVVVTLAVDTPAKLAWRIELDPPGALGRRQISQDQFKAGATVTVVAHPAKDGGASAFAKTVTLPSGQQLVTSSDASWNWRPISKESPR